MKKLLLICFKKTHVKINEEQDGQRAIVEYIKQVCELKTFVGLQPFTRFDAKHHRFKVVPDT